MGNRYGKYRKVFRWTRAGRFVVPVVRALGPLVRAKREQFRAVERYLRGVGVGLRGRRVTPKQRALQEEVYVQLQQLKRRVY